MGLAALMYLFFDNATTDRSAGSKNKSVGDMAVSAARRQGTSGLPELRSMSLEQRRALYRRITEKEPYTPLKEILKLLDHGLADDDAVIRMISVNRFIESRYLYGEQEPAELFNQDEARKKLLVNLLADPEPGIRISALRVLAENYNQQRDVVEVLIQSLQFEKRYRLEMIRNLGHALEKYPNEVRPVFIDEVKLAGNSPSKATPVESAYILSLSRNPPVEILEPVIHMLETSHFGSPLLLETIENFGPYVRPYIDRLKALQEKVDARIKNGRDDKGNGSSTFTRARYEHVLKKIEQGG